MSTQLSSQSQLILASFCFALLGCYRYFPWASFLSVITVTHSSLYQSGMWSCVICQVYADISMQLPDYMTSYSKDSKTISFHQCSITRKNEKKKSSSSRFSRLWCVRSICCEALHHKKKISPEQTRHLCLKSERRRNYFLLLTFWRA
jgi:hypothetical protein